LHGEDGLDPSAPFREHLEKRRARVEPILAVEPHDRWPLPAPEDLESHVVHGQPRLVRRARHFEGLYQECFRSSATIRAGVTGVSVTRTPNGASASSIAFAIAAGGEIAPPSPRPFTPSGLRGDGNSR